MRTKILAIALALPLAMTACENSGIGTKQGIGGVLGGVGGAVAGSQFGGGTGRIAATAAGALLGAYLGSTVGSGLDDADKLKAESAFNKANSAPVGQTISWNNPDNGNRGTVTPTRDGTSASGEYCREYQTTIYVGGKYEETTGIACRQPDGTWRTTS